MNRLLSAAGALLCVALSVAVPACAQTNTTVGLTQPTATNLKIGGFKIPSGFVTFTPTDKNGIPLTISDYTGSQSGPEAIECQVTNGAITGALQENGSFSGNCLIPDSALTIPANIEYTAQVCDTSTGNVTSGKCYSVQGITGLSGLTWALDHYGPPASTSNVQTLQIQQGPTTPSSCLSPYFFVNTSTNVGYLCINNAYVPLTTTSFGLTSFTAGGLNPLFTASLGINPTIAPALSFTLSPAAQNSVWAGPSTGGAGTPGYRTLTSADIPAVSASVVAGAIAGQSGCTGTNVWVPASNTCVAQSGGVTNVSQITSLTGTGATAVSTFGLSLDQIPAGFSISSFSGGSNVEIGATVTNPVFTAAYSSTPTSATITNTDSINSPFTLTSPFTNATITGTFSHAAAATTTFTLTAVGTSTKTATQTINWYPRTFSGAGTAGATGATASGTSAVLTGSTGTLASAGLNNQSSYSCTASSNYCYVLITGGSHTFTSGGFSFPMNTPTAVSFVNANGSTVTMYLYQSTNSLTGTFSLVVAS